MVILNWQKAVDEIANDKVSGATQLTIKAVKVYQVFVERLEIISKEDFLVELSRIGTILREAQPSMISISNIVELVAAQAHANAPKMNLLDLKNAMLDYLTRLEFRILNAKQLIAQQATNLIPQGSVIITLSESSTVEEIIRQAHLAKKISRVIILESRPLLEGLHMARRLLRMGVSVTFIVDAAMGYFCKQADLAIVGADTVQSDGSVVHKVGTYPLALVCADLKKPFYVACDSIKFSNRSIIQNPVKIQTKSPNEILDENDLIGADIQNVYYDITSPEFISGVITEKGVTLPNRAQIKNSD